MPRPPSTTSWPRRFSSSAVSLQLALDLGVDAPAARRLGGPEHAQLAGALADLVEIGAGLGGSLERIVGLGIAGGVEHGGAVAHGAADDVVDGEAHGAVADLADRGAVAGDLHPDQAAVGGGDADRAQAVAGVGHGYHAGGRGAGRAAAGAAAEMWSGFHGLRQAPSRSELVTPGMPNSGVLVLPTRTTPAAR